MYAHQSSGSFNAAAKDVAVEVLTAQGCAVEVSDLYTMKFKATATAEDITGTSSSVALMSNFWLLFNFCSDFMFLGGVKNADHFCYAEETKLAWEAGKLSADITEEQRKLTQADLVIFQVEPRVALVCFYY